MRYEVAISIDGGDICWVNRPFACGSYPDVVIFRLGLKGRLLENEQVVSDDAYQDYKCLHGSDTLFDIDLRVHSSIRARHENVNEILKNFNVIKARFRHDKSLHSFCFHAVARITQLIISHDSPLRSVF